MPDSLLFLSKVRPLELPPVPPCFLCPLSQQVMQDPVLAADGLSYERDRLMSAMVGGSFTSPSTGEPLAPSEICANVGLKAAIDGYMALCGTVQRQWEEVEANVSGCTALASRYMRHQEQQLRELGDALPGRGRLAREPELSTGSSTASCASAELGSSPGPPAREESAVPEKPCSFRAGRAPRSARSEASTPKPTLPRREQLSSLGKLRAALTPRLTPRPRAGA